MTSAVVISDIYSIYIKKGVSHLIEKIHEKYLDDKHPPSLYAFSIESPKSFKGKRIVITDGVDAFLFRTSSPDKYYDLGGPQGRFGLNKLNNLRWKLKIDEPSFISYLK